jgi:uncharacterized protein YjbI with pentapeptide repeats
VSQREHASVVRTAALGLSPVGDYSNFDLSEDSFQSAKLVGAILRGANLRQADLSGAYLRQADLSQADLTGARLVMADLRQARLEGAILARANLSSAVLSGATFRTANLTGCQVTKALLDSANLADADVSGADFRGTRGIMIEQVRAARNWQQAIYDGNLSGKLGLGQSIEIGRHGAARDRAGLSPHGTIAIDLVFDHHRPNLGDLYLLSGEVHPGFPPSGSCDLSSLEQLGFQQLDDFFAISDQKEPIVWLLPLACGAPVAHHPGPYDGIRLELAERNLAAAARFMSAAKALSAALPGTLRIASDLRGSGNAVTLQQLGEMLKAAD